VSTIVTLCWLSRRESHVTESDEFCCPRHQQHSKVRQQFVATAAWWAPLARCHRSSTIQARSAHVSMPPWNCSVVLDGQLYANSRRHWSSTFALCHSAQVDRTALPTERCRSSAFCCCGPVDLELAAWQLSSPRAESQHFQLTSPENVHFYEIY